MELKKNSKTASGRCGEHIYAIQPYENHNNILGPAVLSLQGQGDRTAESGKTLR